MQSHDLTVNDLTFRVSSYSQGRTENCVGVADLEQGAAVKDTQNPHIPHVPFMDGHAWRAFLAVASRDL
jgi:hypothetical protein